MRQAKGLGLEKASTDVDITKEEERMRRLTERIIGCAIEVHRELGPGFLKEPMRQPFALNLPTPDGFFSTAQKFQWLQGHLIGEYKPDLSLKCRSSRGQSVERFDRVFEAQVLTYLR